MNVYRRILRRISPFILCVFLCGLFWCGTAENEDDLFSVQRIGQMICYRDNAFSVHAPENGVFSVTIYDEYCIYRIIRQQISEGTTEIGWDGCGYNGERLDTKYYFFDFCLEGDSGKTYTYSFRSPIVENAQHLQFVLPSAGTAYLSAPADWFVEIKAVRDGTVTIELFEEENDDAEPVRVYEKTVHTGRIEHYTLEKLSGRNIPEPGIYTVRVYEKTRPDEATVFSLTVEPEPEKTLPVTVTGEIMPSPEADDSEIWQAMMQPSVVVDIDPLKHQNVYNEPDEKSGSLGTLHGQTQGLRVLEIADGWAKIGAWNHEEAEYIEGWVPVNHLKVVEPNHEYGLLVDKTNQTMTVFRNGERIETLLVSTGRMDQGKLDRETSAGCFLTGLHRVDFSTQGLKYDFVIQYDGGNLLHQIPYSSDGKRDFTQGKAYLGTKASHACIRIQDEPGEQNGINAYWIWTHLPYRTRIIILDDPEQRAVEKARLSGDTTAAAKSIVSEPDQDLRDGIVITFAGDIIPAYSEGPDSFDTAVQMYGTDYPLEGLKELFENDDLTCVSLACTLKNDSFGEDPYRSVRWRGMTEYTEIFSNASVELVSLGDDHLYDYRQEGFDITTTAVERVLPWTGKDHLQMIEIKGCLFGFASVSQQEYLADTGIIRRQIRELRNAGCQFIIIQCHWGNTGDNGYRKLQEAMARVCRREGADLVIGRHPENVQGIGEIDGMPVAYSLGRLIADRSVGRNNPESIVVQAVFYPESVNKKTEIRLIPVLSDSTDAEKTGNYHPVPAGIEDAERILRQIQADTGFRIPGAGAE